MSADAVAGAIVLVAAFVLIGLLLSALRRRLRRGRDARLSVQWQELVRREGEQGFHLAYVDDAYQHAKNGTKAIITWWATGRQQDTWFARRHVDSGEYLLIIGASGYGPHNHNPDVLYVNHPDGVRASIPGDAPWAWQRHQDRVAAQQARKEAKRRRGERREASRRKRHGAEPENPEKGS